MNLEELSEKWVVQFDFNQDLSEIYFTRKLGNSEGIELVMYDVKTDISSRVLDLTPKDKSIENSGLFFVSKDQDMYFELATVRFDFGIGDILRFNTETNALDQYRALLPSDDFDLEANWNISANEQREIEASKLCKKFLSQNTEIDLVRFNEARNSKYLLGQNSMTFIPLFNCERERDVLDNVNIIEPKTYPELIQTGSSYVDHSNNLDIQWINKKCFNSCTYDYEINYKNDYYFYKKDIELSNSGHIVDWKGGLILLSNHKLIRLTPGYRLD
jgi:hypothetical protein